MSCRIVFGTLRGGVCILAGRYDRDAQAPDGRLRLRAVHEQYRGEHWSQSVIQSSDINTDHYVNLKYLARDTLKCFAPRDVTQTLVSSDHT
jgi:hypothetical protein